MSKLKKSKLRIIGGRWRRRNVEFLVTPRIRPTPNRIRETLFNWLANRVESAVCLDLFAGSGSLGFEAISRGAKSATLIDNNPLACKQLVHEATRLEANNIQVVEEDVCSFLRRTTRAYDLLFVDPPFDSGLLQKVLDFIATNDHILAPSSLIYIEWKAGTSLTPPTGLSVLRKQRASSVQYALLEPGSKEPHPQTGSFPCTIIKV